MLREKRDNDSGQFQHVIVQLDSTATSRDPCNCFMRVITLLFPHWGQMYRCVAVRVSTAESRSTTVPSYANFRPSAKFPKLCWIYFMHLSDIETLCKVLGRWLSGALRQANENVWKDLRRPCSFRSDSQSDFGHRAWQNPSAKNREIKCNHVLYWWKVSVLSSTISCEWAQRGGVAIIANPPHQLDIVANKHKSSTNTELPLNKDM